MCSLCLVAPGRSFVVGLRFGGPWLLVTGEAHTAGVTGATAELDCIDTGTLEERCDLEHVVDREPVREEVFSVHLD